MSLILFYCLHFIGTCEHNIVLRVDFVRVGLVGMCAEIPF